MLNSNQILAEKQEQLSILQEQRIILESKVRGLQVQDDYDLDLIEEVAKRQLGVAEPQEKVIILLPKVIETTKR